MRCQLPRARSSLLVAISAVVLLTAWGAAPQQPSTRPSDQSLAQLARERIQVAEQGRKLAEEHFRRGLTSGGEVLEWTRRLAQAHMDVPESKADRVAFLEGYVRQMKESEEVMKKRFEMGVCGPLDVASSQYYRLEAEIWLAKANEQ